MGITRGGHKVSNGFCVKPQRRGMREAKHKGKGSKVSRKRVQETAAKDKGEKRK